MPPKPYADNEERAELLKEVEIRLNNRGAVAGVFSEAQEAWIANKVERRMIRQRAEEAAAEAADVHRRLDAARAEAAAQEAAARGGHAPSLRPGERKWDFY